MKRFLALALAALAAAGCASKPRGVVIGLALDTLKEERWQRDRDLFVARARELGAEVKVQAANNSDALQQSQVENLLTQGVNVLVVVPHNGKAAAAIVAAAHAAKVPVIAYDRIINDADLDLYISFDNEKVGEMQAEALVQRRPKGNYVLIGGAPTDNNAKMFRDGQMKVLAPFIRPGGIRVLADQWANDWQPAEALKIMENALTRAGNKVDAVVVSNDGLAGGAIQALAEQKLAGQVLVSGQDADLAACRRIVDGTQTMTVYKPIKALATQAAGIAVALAKGQAPQTNRSVNNGRIDVPSVLIDPVAVDKANLDATVIADGFHSRDQVYGR